METIRFLPSYFWTIFFTWFGIVGALLTVVEIVKLAGVNIPPLRVRIARIAALLLFFFASAQAYKDVKDSKPVSAVPNGFVAENPDHANIDKENRAQADEITKLRLQVNDQNSRISRLETEKKTLEDAKNSLQQQLDDRAQRKGVRDGLSKLLDEGVQLNRIASDEKQDVPTEGIADWVSRLEKYLATVDASYVARSRSGAGVNIGGLQSDSPPTPARQRAVGTVRVRLARLEEFIREWSQ